ncbi:MAG: hypothetical protein KJZ65_05625 [Phycisphaerales bacterium]|nr:hypothetical protein [Phycisphaerales bacterium]
MFEENLFAAKRLRVFADQVIRPLVHALACPLEASVFQCTDRIPYEQAVRAEYRPIQTGFRFGPKWSTAWFRVRGNVPAEMASQRVVLRFSSGTEALLYLRGVPVQGLDLNRDAAILFESARGGEPVEAMVEAACNHPFGVQAFEWDSLEMAQRWATDDPGLFTRCELATFDEIAWRLHRTLTFAADLIQQLPEGSGRARDLARRMEQVRAMFDVHNPRSGFEQALAEADCALHNGAAPSATTCFAVGHAHLDTAWLWPIAETRRKAMRTFTNALRLMERFPEYVFLCSQAQQYAWVKESSPAVFEQVKARVVEGRWEPMGAMWIEPDANVPSGESLVRQIIHGERFWRENFGEQVRQRLLFLPDTFGFSGIIPQIMALAGLDTFITNKLWWSDRDEFPWVNFWWRGIDGTKVLSHLTPGQDYNATNTPKELRRGQSRAEGKDALGVWLQPYGFGDGGGGPTDWTFLNAQLADKAEGLARVRFEGCHAFCDELHARADRLETGPAGLPVCDGELYLHYHRGTLTTHAGVKKANAVGESRLRLAEVLAVLAGRGEACRGGLDEVWKLLLLNQFHDILPGSSISEVYVDAERDHRRIAELVDQDIAASVAALAGQADTKGMRDPVLVVNPLSSDWIGLTRGDVSMIVQRLPAMSVRVVDAFAAPAPPTVEVGDWSLQNEHLSVRLDSLARIVSLRRPGADRDAVTCSADGRAIPLNQLVLYDDRPRLWDAWDIDPEHERNARPVVSMLDCTTIERGPGLGAIAVERALGRASRMRQRFVLRAASPRLDIETWIDWREEHTLLRALFPVDVHATFATYDLSFGHIERRTTRSTPAEASAFEVPAHRWMSVAEPGFGVALLNDCKYGHSCHGSHMGLTLLRSPRTPDPQADVGEHTFTYSLMLHDGDWRAGDLLIQAEAMLNHPFAVRIAGGGPGTRQNWLPFRLNMRGPACVQVAALKPGERGGLALRLVERHGARGRCEVDWGVPVGMVRSVDLLERRVIPLPGFVHDGARTVFEVRPFQIVTLAAETPVV